MIIADKNKWGIVILHYKLLDMTMRCTDKLLELYGPENFIVIVDNGSADGSTEILKKQYSDRQNIHIISLAKNVGFSKGNNIGFMFLKKEKCDFIVLLNNDTFPVQKDFFQRIETEYEKSKFDILGPMILDAQYNVVNSYPQVIIHNTIRSVHIGQITCMVKWLLSFVDLDLKLAEYISKMQKRRNDLLPTQRYENVVISGCCMVFSKGYIEQFDGLNPRPFLYLEEELLFVRALKDSLKIIYNPEVKIVHIGEAATAKATGNSESKRRRFRYKNQFKSFFALEEELRSVRSGSVGRNL